MLKMDANGLYYNAPDPDDLPELVEAEAEAEAEKIEIPEWPPVPKRRGRKAKKA